MKRYKLETVRDLGGCSIGCEIKATENTTGEWVKAEEAEKLEQLNKEMLAMLKKCRHYMASASTPSNIHHYREIDEQLQSIITKAEGA